MGNAVKSAEQQRIGLLYSLYPELPHRQCSALVWHTRGREFEPRFRQRLAICWPRLHCNMWSLGGTAREWGGGVTSQLNLPSLMPLPGAG